MSEITKLYENAGIKPNHYHCEGCEYDYEDICPDDCPNSQAAIYPPFTAEKQLAIFKIFCRRYLEVSQHVEENGDLCFGIKATVGDYAVGFNKDFAECLADFVNCLWQSLTEEEKQQVKGILC